MIISQRSPGSEIEKLTKAGLENPAYRFL